MSHPRRTFDKVTPFDSLRTALAEAHDTLVLHADVRESNGGRGSLVGQVLGGRVGPLLTNPDLDPDTWSSETARALLARRPDLASLDTEAAGALVEFLTALAGEDAWALADLDADGDASEPVDGDRLRSDLAVLAANFGWDLEDAGYERDHIEAAERITTEMLDAVEAASELADALAEAELAPYGVSIPVTLAGSQALVHRDPDRDGGLVVELFGGGGGWAEGITTLGIDDIGLEWDEVACRTRVKAGHATVCTDVAAYPTEPFRDRRTWGLIASPPCQPFSAAGKGGGVADLDLLRQGVSDLLAGQDTRAELAGLLRDARAALVLEIVRWARDLSPTWVACEETPRAKPIFDTIADGLQGLGYRTITFVLNAADFGVPQTRVRTFLVAHKRKTPKAPVPTHAEEPGMLDDRQPWVTMAEAVGFGLTKRPSYTIPAQRTNGGGGVRLEGGSGARALIKRAQLAGDWKPRYEPDGTQHPRDGKAAAGSGQLGVPSASEVGVLQGFRPDMPWQGTEAQKRCWAGNAVPPPLARAVIAELAA